MERTDLEVIPEKEIGTNAGRELPDLVWLRETWGIPTVNQFRQRWSALYDRRVPW